MRMIPATPYQTNSKAERVVFDRIKRAFGKEEGYVCFHSLNLTRHARKRFGEIDFLICCPLGIYVLEVKGGRVACTDGEWSFTDKYEQSDTSREGPFKQAQSALHGLGMRLSEALPVNCIREFSIGFGVVLPDCELQIIGSEWDWEQVCGKETSKAIERWLRKLFSYWRAKDSTDRQASVDAVNRVSQFLRPNFETIVPLGLQADEVLDQICSFTESQMLLVDSIELNERIVCEGGAGTGKTLMAVELARRWTVEGSQVAIVCCSEWLKNYLQENNRLSGLIISTATSLKQQMRRAGVDKLDALIVDEAQDFITHETLSVLDECLLNGLDGGRWCMFWDINNQSGMFGDVQQDAIDTLLKNNPQRIPLKRNCRNTAVILDKIKLSIAADMGVQGAGDGPAVREHYVADPVRLGVILDEELDWILGYGLLSYHQITILTDEEMLPFLEACLSMKSSKVVGRLDEYSIRKFPPKNISLTTAVNFKGLENDAIIFVSLSQNLKKNIVQSYVAMSRAKVLLSIVYMTNE